MCYGIPFFNSSVCSGQGSCVSQNNCTCYPGYSGLVFLFTVQVYVTVKGHAYQIIHAYALLVIQEMIALFHHQKNVPL